MYGYELREMEAGLQFLIKSLAENPGTVSYSVQDTDLHIYFYKDDFKCYREVHFKFAWNFNQYCYNLITNPKGYKNE
jgi:hypothetical protein